jgi:GMP synthase (glutamine-hydrolysing)
MPTRPILVLQHVAHEPLAALEAVFRQSGLAWQYVELFRPAVAELEHLPLEEEAAGLVVLGGPMNDEVRQYPFLAREIPWIRQALAIELPVLGICLGAQLLAKALGAKVFANGRKEIGWYPIQITPEAADDPLFAGTGPSATVFQWHGDTFDLPDGGVRLARAETCENQAFRYGPSAWALQFHVEMTAGLIDAWLDDARNASELAGLDYIDPVQIRARTPEHLPAMEALGGKLLPRFAALCRDRG